MTKFAKFDVVTDDSDHFFRGSNDGKCINNNSKGEVYRSIMREWKILEQNLPESIYVRVYERRIDLMRAVIVGVAGTPYHDALFFFDIAFPYDYPNHPPKLNFHSFGHRVNPNLYNSGKVCLSLLNTWTGMKKEQWDPHGSTMLQVLLSIQGLVLNEKPYFNEPGIGLAFFCESLSLEYNEAVYVLNLKIAHRLLRKPPRNFDAFVRAFYRERGPAIMDACDHYMHCHVRVGYFTSGLGSGSASKSSDKEKIQLSRYFMETMKDMAPRLLKAFRENGAPIMDRKWKWEEPLDVENEDDKSGKPKSMLKKVVEKIKKAFRWKTKI
ncbi:hypothetical protein Fmac_013391 [Flemingia macrophylla]|uniref:UBC core domain-containing protein n=1 Tax=Flemingia macrophylla TaxID=520843 RepID=A0ABD1MV96_9FABA